MIEEEIPELTITFVYPPGGIISTYFYFDTTRTAGEALDGFLWCHSLPPGEYRLALKGNKIIDPNHTLDSIGIDNGASITVVSEIEARENGVPCTDKKTIKRLSIDGELHRHPADPTCVLWRYMDLAKFESLITSGALFFSRADKFRDAHEGELPAGNQELIFSQVAQIMGDRKASYSADWTEGRLRGGKTRTTVSCWSMGSKESLRLWGEYVQDNDGVAIRTSFEMLTKSIENKDVKYGVVKYVDLSKGYNADIFVDGRYGVCTTKDVFFEFERELRAILFDQECNRGVFTNVNVATLFDTVVLRPHASRRLSDRVSALLALNGLTQDVRESQL